MAHHLNEGGIASFESAYRAAAEGLRRALLQAFAHSGGDPAVPMELARHLGLDKSLAWKVARLATDDDLIAAPDRIPGRAGLKLLERALRDARVPEPEITAVADAFAQFQDVTLDHAGDRETLAAMLAGMADADATLSEAQRRLAFLGNSATWGVRARAQLSAHFVAPSASPGRLDIAIACGFVDFQRLRPDVPWAMATMRHVLDTGDAAAPRGPQPIDPSATGGVPLMPEFCSSPLPPLHAATRPDGATPLLLGPGPVGRHGRATVVCGWLTRDAVAARRGPEGDRGDHFAMLATPAETIIHDLYVHRSLDFAARATPIVFSLLPGGPAYPHEDVRSRLANVKGRVTELGSPPDCATPVLRTYRPLVARVIERLGWMPSDFVGRRYLLAFPPIPAAVAWRYELPG